MFLLAEAMGKMAKSICLSIDMDKVDAEFVTNLSTLAKEHLGTCPIRIRLNDPENGKNLVLKSTNTKVEPQSFLQDLEKMRGVQYIIE